MYTYRDLLCTYRPLYTYIVCKYRPLMYVKTSLSRVCNCTHIPLYNYKSIFHCIKTKLYVRSKPWKWKIPKFILKICFDPVQCTVLEVRLKTNIFDKSIYLFSIECSIYVHESLCLIKTNYSIYLEDRSEEINSNKMKDKI